MSVILLSKAEFPMVRIFSFLLLACVAAVTGCGGDGRSKVTGTVQYKGQPIKAGVISFIEEGAVASAGGSAITDGKYELPGESGLKPGKYSVSINVPDSKAKMEAMPGISGPEPKETLPAKYNAKTELKAEIKAGGKNVFDFDLK